ncbi:hypothetical protein [Marinimicrobium sp. ARAG 43.8]|uniref:hypothetical protein n=1 Tax=Marinimicrobium sp. ARAG 43.8 TaxID=3418719 RepID=UPI003CF13E99
MEPLDYDNWDVDVTAGRAVHACGFQLEVEGSVSDPSGVFPSGYPDGLSYAEQARLLRSGMQALASAGGGGAVATPRGRQPSINPKAQQAGQKARMFAEQSKDRPARAKLSLKRSPANE